MNALFTGRHPRLDPFGKDWPRGSVEAKLAGTEIAGGKRFIVWVGTGDLEWWSNYMCWPHFNSDYPCWFDSVSRAPGTDAPITDLSRDAGWKDTMLSEEELEYVIVPDHPINDIVGWTRRHVPGDLRHTGDLGVLAWVLGSVLWELFYDGPLVGVDAERLSPRWVRIGQRYALVGCTSLDWNIASEAGGSSSRKRRRFSMNSSGAMGP